jgi:hypothetical protein
MDGAGSNDDGGKHKQAAQAAQPEGSDAKPLDTPGDEANDDEQVERFYALLANIRAMRSMYTPGGDRKKRPRGASEPPWRPAFRLEDFEEDDAAAATSRRWAKKKEASPPDDGEDKEGGGPAVVASPSSALVHDVDGSTVIAARAFDP